MIKNLGVTFLVATLLAPGAAWAEGGKIPSPNTNRTPVSEFDDVEIVLERHRAYCASEEEREREINQEIEKREAERRRINEEIKRNDPEAQFLIYEHLGYPICNDGGIENRTYATVTSDRKLVKSGKACDPESRRAYPVRSEPNLPCLDDQSAMECV